MNWLKVITVSFLITVAYLKPAASEEIRIAVGDWPPYLSEKLKHSGIIGHLLTDIFTDEGFEVSIRFFPWARAYDAAKVGKLDMTGVWMHKQEREKDFYYSDPVLNEKFVFFHLKSSSFDWNSLDDLKGLSIGGGNDYSYGADFDKAIESGDISIQRVPNKLQNWRKLFLGRILIYPEEINVGYSSLNQLFHVSKASHVTHHPKPLLNNLSYLLLPKSSDRSQALMKKFNARLKAFREDGRYDRYFKLFQEGYYDQK